MKQHFFWFGVDKEVQKEKKMLNLIYIYIYIKLFAWTTQYVNKIWQMEMV